MKNNLKNPYDILGLNASCEESELKARYEELKAKYSEDRFLPGELGNEGARKLTELESAWAQVSADLSKRNAQQNFGSDLGEIDDLIKKGMFDQAQGLLDTVSARTAEWYYLQSIIYYKREWLSDSRKQLAIAVNMEPRNEKYKTALEKLDMVMGSPNADPHTLGAEPPPQGNVPPQGQPGQGQMCGGNMMSNCCLAYCCTDCCCNMARCCG